MDSYVEHLVKEVEFMAGQYAGQKLDTLYLGGGSPSLLSKEQLDRVLGAIDKHFTFRSDPEWTIECNPDDLSPDYLDALQNRGFNRISIGIQSFDQGDLELMRRSHHARQAHQSVLDAASAGFRNITMDLIYGIPGQLPETWEQNISTALSLPVSHISAYHLTFEPGTVFDHWRKKGRLVPVHEEESVAFYRVLRERLTGAGYDHYEISNFALKGRMSEHNLLYWSGRPYLGFGPSAHSFDGTQRRWNVSKLQGYMNGVDVGVGFSQSEDLSLEERYHDYLITSMRTRWGADPWKISEQFGEKLLGHFKQKSESFLEEGTLWHRDGKVAIHPDHWLITDHILRELFVD